MNGTEKFEFSDLEISRLSEEDFKIARLPDFYITRIIFLANKLGLEGKKVKEIYSIQESFANRRVYLDFTCEEK